MRIKGQHCVQIKCEKGEDTVNYSVFSLVSSRNDDLIFFGVQYKSLYMMSIFVPMWPRDVKQPAVPMIYSCMPQCIKVALRSLCDAHLQLWVK